MGLLLAQNIVSGLLVGCVYGLVSLGLSILYGVMKFVNFGHGAVMMLGMYLMEILYKYLHLDPFLGLFIVVPASFAFGYILAIISEPVIVRERTTNSDVALLLTMGFSLIMVNGAQIIFGPEFHSVTSFISGRTFDAFGLIINIGKLVAALITLVVYGAIFFFLKNTDLGRSIRALSQDMDSAKLMGISERRIFRLGFAICTATVGVAGMVILPFYSINPTVGDVFQLKAFIIVVLGGLGSILGTLVGGLIVGGVEALGATFFNSSYAQMFIFIVFLIVIIVRPRGLMGKEL